MLSNLTKRLIESTWSEKNKELMVEGAALAANEANLKKYSILDESVNIDNFEAALNSVTVDDENTSYDAVCDKLYEACMNESVTIKENDKMKILIMSKNDYDKIISIIALYKKATDDNEKKVYRNKIISCINTINTSINKADEVDTFTNSVVRKIYNIVCDDKPEVGVDKDTIKANIKKIKSAIK